VWVLAEVKKVEKGLDEKERGQHSLRVDGKSGKLEVRREWFRKHKKKYSMVSERFRWSDLPKELKPGQIVELRAEIELEKKKGDVKWEGWYQADLVSKSNFQPSRKPDLGVIGQKEKQGSYKWVSHPKGRVAAPKPTDKMKEITIRVGFTSGGQSHFLFYYVYRWKG
jgi:hypothetical protein